MSAQSGHRLPQPETGPRRVDAEWSPRILLAEDDEPIRKLNTNLLRNLGYRVDDCEDGAAAWNLLKTHQYDLLIADYKMPHVTGVELVEKLRSANLTLPVILLSGALPAEELDEKPWLRIGVAINKPYLEDELLGSIRKLLQASDSNGSERESSRGDRPKG